MSYRVAPAVVMGSLAVLTLLACLLSLAFGPMRLPLGEMVCALGYLAGLPLEPSSQALLVIGQIRLPRMLIGLTIGSILSGTGVAMQALFRNPLADPALIGVSAGAALGAALAINGLGTDWTSPTLRPYLVSGYAFLGGLAITMVVYRLGSVHGQTRVGTMLLAGVALTAMAGALVGLLSYLADDATLRQMTTWSMGSLGGASYARLWPLVLLALPILFWLPRRSKALNLLLLGESEARHLGINVERLKQELVLVTALGVGACVAAAGLIGFVGLVVPHILRLLIGPDHRVLLPAALLGGAGFLLLADLTARLLLAPAELPIGIVTALIGAPLFLFLLLRRGA
ncbi:FecCD family ABC transporter permease [Pseudomonas oryzihabitans]|uniref:FecCD family ABC transporter permease n=1 Tax=Pseudomonas oryzihabitans TaxID=47885 RepID=UPI002893F0FA|nr:iron chelate uptake ABC transporter family permease subunit [Pseudomonas oryzihabitans]MDT3723142.1 iron chelate uptake ABC transporter family permease subunit [Pseudomonas oryzihabitans]